MEKVVNKDGKTIQINVEQLDGSVRRTTYNPETGKPIRTYTNTGKEPVELIYDQYGRSVKTRKVNVKKQMLKMLQNLLLYQLKFFEMMMVLENLNLKCQMVQLKSYGIKK